MYMADKTIAFRRRKDGAARRGHQWLMVPAGPVCRGPDVSGSQLRISSCLRRLEMTLCASAAYQNRGAANLYDGLEAGSPTLPIWGSEYSIATWRLIRGRQTISGSASVSMTSPNGRARCCHGAPAVQRRRPQGRGPATSRDHAQARTIVDRLFGRGRYARPWTGARNGRTS